MTNGLCYFAPIRLGEGGLGRIHQVGDFYEMKITVQIFHLVIVY